ncbi:MBL fold metallo-hydrolase [Desertivirga xinjiangensis]|uniref:MBL fold metallo-hydrolase n=1 Tax=Desertivirga xinjiangensis TaxID=539206 RepID=UPI0021096690|nr:MBL fold metallo-hydrolase [Pedobacter xinjiangensis]
MILADFLVYDEKGLFCKVGNFYLDPHQAVQTAVISHAHGDHACSGNTKVYCTPATASIMQLRLKKNAGEEFLKFPYEQKFTINNVVISFFPAGHILGSAMVLMEYQGIRYLYTGDFKLQEDATCEPAELVEADVFITETTFADPEIKHPDPVEQIIKLNDSHHNVLLGAYALGKAQRIVNLIHRNCPARKVYLHHSMLSITKLYEDFAFNPGSYEPYNRKLMKLPGKGFVYIVPPLTFDSYFRAKGVLRMFASGWKRLQHNNDASLYISDHADWDDILKSIQVVRPREIWTLHGDGTHLRKHFEGKLPVKILI